MMQSPRHLRWRDSGEFLIVMGGVLVLTVAATTDTVSWATAFVLGAGVFVTRPIGSRLSNPKDRSWLSAALPVAFLAKMIGGMANYYVTTSVYGIADAIGYHKFAVDAAAAVRQFQLPTIPPSGLGIRSTQFIATIVYAVFSPDMLGGFLLFSAIAFVGSVCFYLAFRRALPNSNNRLFFAIIFFLPTLLFFPSAVGKDALMVLFLGIAALGAANLFTNRVGLGLSLSVVGATASFVLRPHIAVLVIASVAAAIGLSLLRDSRAPTSTTQKLIGLGVALAGLAIAFPLARQYLGVEGDLLTFATEVQFRTNFGASAVEAQPLGSPTTWVVGSLTVLSRPFPHEAPSLSQFLISLEGLAILLAVLSTVPRAWRNRHQFLVHPYLTFALAFSVGFLITLSPLTNLGTIARQRAQMLPFLIAIIVFFSRERGAIPRTLSSEERGSAERLRSRS